MSSRIDQLRPGDHTDIRGPDTCERCASSRPETVYGLTALGTPTAMLWLLCTHDQVIATYNGSRVSAGCAREYVCHGRLWTKGASA